MVRLMQPNELKKDFLGRWLCLHCTNGVHYVRKTNVRTGKKTGAISSNCLQGGCQCYCRERLEEKQRRARRHGPSLSPRRSYGKQRSGASRS